MVLKLFRESIRLFNSLVFFLLRFQICRNGYILYVSKFHKFNNFMNLDEILSSKCASLSERLYAVRYASYKNGVYLFNIN